MPDDPRQVVILAAVCLGFIALWWAVKDGR